MRITPGVKLRSKFPKDTHWVLSDSIVTRVEFNLSLFKSVYHIETTYGNTDRLIFNELSRYFILDGFTDTQPIWC